MKSCIKCFVEKELSSFYAHPQMKDGHLNKCKECTKKDVSNNYRKNIDSFKAYDKERNKTQKRKDRFSEASKRARTKNPVQYGARIMVSNAVRDGRLHKPESCSCCGKISKLDGHHCDYAKPLDVIWLCRQCHNDWHKTNNPINGD